MLKDRAKASMFLSSHSPFSFRLTLFPTSSFLPPNHFFPLSAYLRTPIPCRHIQIHTQHSATNRPTNYGRHHIYLHRRQDSRCKSKTNMPFIHSKPWRVQFFNHIKCPEDVFIPTEDCDAWRLCPEHRWVYNKLTIALAQGLKAAPHCVLPPKASYPVFSKPLMNLKGMGAGSRVIPDEATFLKSLQPGHFWCTLLKGRHVSTDAAFVNGEMVWSRHTTGVPIGDGMFDYWHLHKEAMPEIEDWCGSWARKHLTGYTGMANFETIGGKIIEMHLRFTPQWADLYGDKWLNAVVRLYVDKVWELDDSGRIDQYSVILWGSQQRSYCLPPAAEISRAAAVPGVSSIQVPFHENMDPTTASNPPGGFRLAIVNSYDLEAGRKATKILREAIKEVDTEPHVNGVTGRATCRCQ